MMIFLVLFLFGTLQASQIPAREEYKFRLLPEFMPQPKSLTEAVRWGSLEQVQRFLLQRWNPNGVDENGRTSMHYAVFRQDDEVISILHALLAAGGNVYIQDRFQKTPVGDALELDNKEALKIFIGNCRLLIDSRLQEKYPVIDKALSELVPVRSSTVMVPVRCVSFQPPC